MGFISSLSSESTSNQLLSSAAVTGTTNSGPYCVLRVVPELRSKWNEEDRHDSTVETYHRYLLPPVHSIGPIYIPILDRLAQPHVQGTREHTPHRKGSHFGS